MTSEPGAFLTVPEVAREIRASTERTYGLIAAGTIPAVRIGRRVRIPRAAFEQWLNELSQQALAGVADGAQR